MSYVANMTVVTKTKTDSCAWKYAACWRIYAGVGAKLTWCDE